MGRCDGFRGGGSRGTRIVGVVLMIAGVLVLLLSIPSWLWATLLGLLLTSVGFLIWRFS